MTAITMPNLWQQITSLFNPSKSLPKPSLGISPDILDSIGSAHRAADTVSIRAAKFRQSLQSSVDTGVLSWSLISDTPSTLPAGIVTLSYDRLMALLEEQHLPFAHLSPIQFHLLVSSAFPSAKLTYIDSEQSLVVSAGQQSVSERREGYVIELQTLVEIIEGV